jgi:hypothetical protein
MRRQDYCRRHGLDLTSLCGIIARSPDRVRHEAARGEPEALQAFASRFADVCGVWCVVCGSPFKRSRSRQDQTSRDLRGSASRSHKHGRQSRSCSRLNASVGTGGSIKARTASRGRCLSRVADHKVGRIWRSIRQPKVQNRALKQLNTAGQRITASSLKSLGIALRLAGISCSIV